jgi:hypothetical protein
MMRVTMPSEGIEPTLPRGVVLPAEASKPGYRHPVNIAFGYQRNIHATGLGLLPGFNYMELVIAIPDLCLSPAVDHFSGPCSTFLRLDLNELVPIILGRVVGWPKMLRRIQTDANSFRIINFWLNSLLVSGTFQPFGKIGHPGQFSAFADIMRTFAQPVVSHSILGHLMFNRLTWHWDRVVLQEVDADLSVRAGFGVGHYVRTRGANDKCQGAWRVLSPWNLSFGSHPKPAGRGHLKTGQL